MDTKLKSILQKEKLEHLLSIFTDQGVTDSILGDLSADDLRDLGIDKLGERKRLLAAFAEEIGPAATDKLERDEPLATRQEDFTYEAANGEITITGFSGKGHVVIPDEFDDLPLPVRTIGKAAFKDNGVILSVKIPNSINSIMIAAFHSCSSLASITIPNSLKAIDTSFFRGCAKLQEVNVNAPCVEYQSIDGVVFDNTVSKIIAFPPGRETYVIPPGVKTIGNEFSFCTGLACIKIPDSVTIIGDGAFQGCTNLTNLTIPNSVTKIGSSAFCGCTSLVSIKLPDNITVIESSTFDGCHKLSNITIPKGVVTIGSCAFRECSKLESAVIPDGVTTINTCAFDGAGLKSIRIPDSVTKIEPRTFYTCWVLKSVKFPSNLKTIGREAFDGCNSLTDISIPDGVTEIVYGAFAFCPNECSVAVREWEERQKQQNKPSLTKWLFG